MRKRAQWRDLSPEVVQRAFRLRRGDGNVSTSWPVIAKMLGVPWQSLVRAVNVAYYGADDGDDE